MRQEDGMGVGSSEAGRVKGRGMAKGEDQGAGNGVRGGIRGGGQYPKSYEALNPSLWKHQHLF